MKTQVVGSMLGEMEASLSASTDHVVALQSETTHRSCRDIRMLGIPEDSSCSTTAATFSALLKEALSLETSRPSSSDPAAGRWPWSVAARLYYHAGVPDHSSRAAFSSVTYLGSGLVCCTWCFVLFVSEEAAFKNKASFRSLILLPSFSHRKTYVPPIQ